MHSIVQSKKELYIEKANPFKLDAGTLTYYETNCMCENIEFEFDSYVISMMLHGHKSITSAKRQVEFYPGLIYVPEKGSLFRVSMNNASIENPTRALILKLDNHFLTSYIQSLKERPVHDHRVRMIKSEEQFDYFSQNSQLIASMTRLYKINQFGVDSMSNEISSLIVKEIILHLYRTDCLPLLLENCYQNVSDNEIRNAIMYIDQNLDKPIAVETLMEVSCLGKTTFFNRFIKALGRTPITYINEKRIMKAKSLLHKEYTFAEVGFLCGFSTYQNFSKTFKKITGKSLKEYRSNLQ